MNNDIDKNSHANTRVPTTIKKMYNIYLDHMTSMLSQPNIDTDTSHTFISSTELVWHAFALGIDCQQILSHDTSVCLVLSSD